MQDVFGTVVFVVAAVGAIVAIITLVGSGRSYRQIGRGGLMRDGDAGSGGPAAEREEIRQMLGARNARRAPENPRPPSVSVSASRPLRFRVRC